MKMKSEVRRSKSKARKSKIEDRSSKIGPNSVEIRISNFEPRRRTSNLGPRTLVIGYGNPLRSDDGFGWHAAGLIAQALSDQDVGAPLVGSLERAGTRPAPATAEVRSQDLHVEVVTCFQLTPELAEPLSQCTRAVFIDADAEGPPGEIHRRDLPPDSAAPLTFTHTCTPTGLLANAESLYGHRPRAVAITVSAQTFDFGDAMSPAVSAALPKVAEYVCAWLSGRSSRLTEFPMRTSARSRRVI